VSPEQPSSAPAELDCQWRGTPLWGTGLALFVAAVAIAGAALPASSQVTGNVSGTVRDLASEHPVASARVDLLDQRGRRVTTVLSDSAGEFRFGNVQRGEYSLRASALGFREVTTPALAVVDSVTVVVIVRLAADAVALAPLEVVTRPAPLHRNVMVAGLLERQRRGMGGAILLREQLEERQPPQLTDLLRTMGSFTVLSGRGGEFGGTVWNNRAQCQPSVFIDGRIVFESSNATDEEGAWRGSAYDAINSVHWTEVEGVEVYSGVSTLPAIFSGSRSGCGVIAIWTRR
jgi:hypothetical protein